MLAWASAIGILGLSVPVICNSEFFYSQSVIRRSDECNLCFKKDCLTLDKARCDYFAEADSILPKDKEVPGGIEDAAKRKEVDDLMFDLVDKRLSNNMECIPYVSRYTNCNKENVCLDCKTCSCSPKGKWLCTTLQPCHNQGPPLNVDHRILVMVMEALTDKAHPKKTKRSVTDRPKDVVSTITLEKLSEWLYGAKPLYVQENSSAQGTTTAEFTLFVDHKPSSETATTITAKSKATGLTTTESIAETTTIEDTDYVAFDEVLRSISVDPAPYSQRKPTDNVPTVNVNKNETFSIDYMIMDEDNETSGTSNDDLGDVINFMLNYDDVVTDSPVTSTAEVVIDLLPTAANIAKVKFTEDHVNNNNDIAPNIFDNTNDILLSTAGNFAKVNITEDERNVNKYFDPNFIDITNDILQYNALNIMKRDVTVQDNITASNVVPIVTIMVDTTNATINNKTEEFPELKDKVLTPINKIISDKIKELENLQKIKEDLLKFVKTNIQPEDIRVPEENNTSSKTSFSIYNIAMATGLDVDLRRANPNRYDKYMLKLKSDIFTVVKDLAIIQRHKNTVIPPDLKLLMNAMKRYVYNNKLVEQTKRTKLRKQKGFRRMMDQTKRYDRLSFKHYLVQIIEVIDKDKPVSNALAPLSPASRKIMKHVIKSYYVDQQVLPGLKVHDPYYNLTNYLNSIGSKWQEVSAILIRSTPSESLHRMKLLHCTLALDINKMHDAIGLIDFAHSRRMVTMLDKVSDKTIDKIDSGLSEIHNKILMLIKFYKRKPKSPERQALREKKKETATQPPPTTIKDRTVAVERQKKKRSFIKHIRTLLKTSKNDIAELLHRKVPKSEIVKQLAKKRLDEISEKRYSEYEDTMRRWQQNLEVTARLKRSVLDQSKTRSLKNIIPRYLRHKVNPRIKEDQKNATAEATRKANAKKKKKKGKVQRKSSRRGNKTRKTTAANSKISPKPKTRKVTRPPTIKKFSTSTISATKTH